MNEIENNELSSIGPRFMTPSIPVENTGPSMGDMIAGILRRWYIVLPVFIVITAVTIPVIWKVKKTEYVVQGAIRVAPILVNILSGEADRGEISNVDNFMNTQARVITSTQICERVADDLSDKNLLFLKEGTFDLIAFAKEKFQGVEVKLGPVEILKDAISKGVISAAPVRKSELIMVTMTYKDAGQARQIVDSFIRAYMAVEVSAATQGEDRKLSVLENEHKLLAEKIKNQRSAIKSLAREFGSKKLDSRREMKLERVGMLLNQVTEYQAKTLRVGAQVSVLKNRVALLEVKNNAADPNTEDYIVDLDDPARAEYINADATVVSMTTEIAQMKRHLTELGMALKPNNPQYHIQQKVLEELESEVEKRKEEVGRVYDGVKEKRFNWESKQELVELKNELARAEAELELNEALEIKFSEMLAKEDDETISVGRKQLDIEDIEDQLTLDKETYDLITRRIQEMEMQRKRPARISVAYNADVAQKNDKRIKFSLASVFGAMAAGVGLAFLFAKNDQRLRRPDDVVKVSDIRVIGTTTSIGSVKKSLMPGRISEDFQTIRANLSILNGNGGVAPGMLVITSPGAEEGKTTLSINLATSMAKSGKKVLLIDGDMRSPSITDLLNLPKGTRGLQDYLFGADLSEAVCSMPATGLDVLACDGRNQSDAFELLSSNLTKQYMDVLSKKYDHVIVDTPPALLFPDAMIWAKMAECVVLSCFVGRTTTVQLKLAKERLAQVGVKVVGTVLSNVPSEHGYFRYGGYSGRNYTGRQKKTADADSLFIHMHESDDQKIEGMGFE